MKKFSLLEGFKYTDEEIEDFLLIILIIRVNLGLAFLN